MGREGEELDEEKPARRLRERDERRAATKRMNAANGRGDGAGEREEEEEGRSRKIEEDHGDAGELREPGGGRRERTTPRRSNR